MLLTDIKYIPLFRTYVCVCFACVIIGRMEHHTHNIKNTEAAVACYELEEKYRCALNVHLMPKTIQLYFRQNTVDMNYFLYSNFSAHVY